MDAQPAYADGEAPPGAPDNQVSWGRKAMRIVRGALEGIGAVAVAFGLAVGIPLASREPTEADASKAQFEKLAERVCARAAGNRSPNEPQAPGTQDAAFYDCLTDKLVAAVRAQPR